MTGFHMPLGNRGRPLTLYPCLSRAGVAATAASKVRCCCCPCLPQVLTPGRVCDRVLAAEGAPLSALFQGLAFFQ